MLLMHANNREDIKEAPAGDTTLVVQKTHPPATRCAIPIIRLFLSTWFSPEPVIEIAIEPKSKADQEKIVAALAKLAAEDPTFCAGFPKNY